jgi:DNA primase
MGAIDEIKQKIDIAEVIGQYTSLKKAGRNLTALCPFHSEKHPSFFVYPEQQSWHCFGACNTGGDVFAFIMKKEGLDFGEALRLLAGRAGVALPSREKADERKEEKEALYKVNEAAAIYFNNLLLNHPGGEAARRYVEKRGFTQKTVADFQLGYSLDSWEALKQYLEKTYSENDMLNAGLLVRSEDGRTHDRFRGKLMVPIRDIRGRVTGFGARVLDDSLPKYVNSPQTPLFDKSGTLYAIDRAAPEIRKRDAAIIMEGYMDVITAHQHGVTNAVACMGTAITEKAVYDLKKLTRNLIFALDADTAGSKAMLIGTSYEKLLSAENRDIEKAPAYSVELENLLDSEVKVVIMPEGKDPDDVIKEDIETWYNLVKNALPIIDYTLNTMTSGLDLTLDKNQKILFEKFAPIVAEIKNKIRQSYYINKLAKLLGQDLNKLTVLIDSFNISANKRFKPEPKKVAPKIIRSIKSNPREEYLLALLLQNPGLDRELVNLSEEHFTGSENREIFNAWQTAEDVMSIRERLDPALREHFDALASKSLPPPENIEKRCVDCTLKIRIKYLQDLEARKAAAGEIEASRPEEDVELSSQLRELYASRSRKNAPRTGGSTRS